MEDLHHELWIVHIVNALVAPVLRPVYGAIGIEWPANGQPIPEHLVMAFLVVGALTLLSLIVRSRLSVENPGKLQILLEDMVGFFNGMLRENIGPKGPKYLPLVGALGLFIFVSNMSGHIPGLMPATGNLNVTVGCAVTVWVYYHLQGIRAQGLLGYAKHFFVIPGLPIILAPLVGLIEIISHLSRVMSLSLRLFGNVFGEEMVVLILAMLVPFIIPLPMMLLGIITGTLQAYIFVLLSMIYLAGAVHTDHDHEHEAHHGEAPVPAAA